MKKRIDEIDVLRGIAFLAVVLQHSLAGFIYEPTMRIYESIPAALMLNIVRFAVPLFVFITGFSLYYSDKGNSYLEFIKKRFKQIIVPYLLWTIIYDLFMFFVTGMKWKSLYDVLVEYIKYVFTGTASYHLWYMVMIIQFYLIYPLFKKIINKDKTKNNNTLVLIIFFIGHIFLLYWYNFYSGYMYEASSGALRYILVYRDRLFIMWMFYFVFGGYFALYFKDIKSLLWKIRYITGFLFIASLTYVMTKMIQSATVNGQGGYIINHFLGSPLNILMFPLLLSSILFIYPVAEYILSRCKYIGERLIIVGKYSFGAYLIHALVLHYVNTLLRMFIPWFYVKLTLSFILTCLVSIGIIKALTKSKNSMILASIGIGKK